MNVMSNSEQIDWDSCFSSTELGFGTRDNLFLLYCVSFRGSWAWGQRVMQGKRHFWIYVTSPTTKQTFRLEPKWAHKKQVDIMQYSRKPLVKYTIGNLKRRQGGAASPLMQTCLHVRKNVTYTLLNPEYANTTLRGKNMIFRILKIGLPKQKKSFHPLGSNLNFLWTCVSIMLHYQNTIFKRACTISENAK
jgi:hypothetical protein